MTLPIFQLGFHKTHCEIFQEEPSLAVFLHVEMRVVVHENNERVDSMPYQAIHKTNTWANDELISSHCMCGTILIDRVNTPFSSIIVNDDFRLEAPYFLINFIIIVNCGGKYNCSVSFWDVGHHGLSSTEAKN